MLAQGPLAYQTFHAFCRLVYDRETGKPKGYGFCEYQDMETAQSAMRNLNNYDFNGRPLRVGFAAGEQSKEDLKGMQQAVGGMVLEVRRNGSSSPLYCKDEYTIEPLLNGRRI